MIANDYEFDEEWWDSMVDPMTVDSFIIQCAQKDQMAEGKKKVEFSDLLKLYVKVNKKIKEKPELEKKVFTLLNKLESGDAPYHATTLSIHLCGNLLALGAGQRGQAAAS